MNIIDINSNSLKSFFIEMLFNDMLLAKGTAFFAGNQEKFLLFTNRHNVTGLDNVSNKPLSTTGGVPNKLKILLPRTFKSEQETGSLLTGDLQYFTIPLYSDNNMESPVWFEHPNNEVDVVGIWFNPVEIDKSHFIFSLEESWRKSEITDLVNVIGYPFGLSANYSPIWMTGYIASEPNINYDDLPLFLIDCRTRKGQSGSPVISRIKVGENVHYEGQNFKAKIEQTHLLGIYSGRINAESDIGKVWKKSALRDIFEVADKKLSIIRPSQ